MAPFVLRYMSNKRGELSGPDWFRPAPLSSGHPSCHDGFLVDNVVDQAEQMCTAKDYGGVWLVRSEGLPWFQKPGAGEIKTPYFL